MTSPYEPPQSKMAADRPSLADITLRRADLPHNLIEGAFSEAWYWVKKRPGETIGFSLLTLIFGGSNCNGGNLGDLGSDSGGDYGGYDDYGYENFFSDLLTPSLTNLFEAWWSSLVMFVGRLAGALALQEDLDALLGQLEAPIIIGFVLFAVVVGLIFWVIGTFFEGGANIFWLRMIRGQEARFGNCTRAWAHMVPLLLSGLLAGLAVAGGLLLLIIPGIIIALGFWFVTLVIVDKNLGTIEGLQASWRLVDGYKWDLFVLAILSVLLNILGLLLCCLGIVVTNAVTMGAVAIVYDRLAEPGNAYFDPHEVTPETAPPAAD